MLTIERHFNKYFFHREEEERDLLKQENGENAQKDEPGPWKINKDALTVESSEAKSDKTPEEENVDVIEKKNETSNKVERPLDSDSGAEGVQSEGKKYVPPHLRGKPSVAPLSSGPSENPSTSSNKLAPVTGASLRRGPKSSIPQINNESDFPSL